MDKVNIYTRTGRRYKHVDENSKKKILMLKIKKNVYMITIKKKLTEIKNVFDRLISRLTQTEKKKKISELEDMSIQTLKTKKQREKKIKDTNSSRTLGQLQKVTYV